MAVVDSEVADAADRATDGYLSDSQACEQLVYQLGALEAETYDRAHADAIFAALCFRLLPDGTFHGDFAGSGPAPWPRTVAELPSEVLELWGIYAGRVRSPALRARLHELLAAAGTSGRHTHTRAAVSAYREAAAGFLVSADKLRGQLRAVESLGRALDITVRMNQRDLRELVAQDMIRVADSLLGEQPVPAGLVYALLERLQSHRLEVDAVRSLTETACAACPDNIHLLAAFLRLLRSGYTNPVAQKEIDRRIVTAMIASAEVSPPMLRLMTLNDAAVFARNAGLHDLFTDVTRKIQGIRRADLGLVPTAGIPIRLTPAELDAALAEVDQATDLADALWRIAGTSPPAGSTAVAKRAARALSASAPLASSIHRGRINPAGPVPVSLEGTDGQASVEALFQVVYLERTGLAVEAQLDRVMERFAPDEAALTAVLAHKALGSESRTRMLVHAFTHFWAGEDDAAIHLVLSRVEALLREIERDRGVLVVSVPQGKTPGGVSQLGGLISAMPAAGFDEDWKRSFELLLTDGESGLNLRNNVGHGLCDCPPRHHIALALHAALHLLAITHGVIQLREAGEQL